MRRMSNLLVSSLYRRSILINCAQYPHQDSKRVLECLQKSLRIANSAIEEIVTVQLYCDTLDQYLYYLDHGASAVSLSSDVNLK